MSKSKSRKKRPPKRVLALPDLEHAKTAVLNSLTSASGQRTYDHAIREFVTWYCSEPRLAFNRTVVLRYGFTCSTPADLRGHLRSVSAILQAATLDQILVPARPRSIRAEYNRNGTSEVKADSRSHCRERPEWGIEPDAP